MKEEYAKTINDYQNNLHTLELLDATHKTVIESIQHELEQEKDASQIARNKVNEAQKKLNAICSQYEISRQELKQENVILTKKIEKLKRSEAIYKYYKKGRNFSETDSVKLIRKLIGLPLAAIEEKEWGQLLNTVSLYYPTLIHDLRNAHGITQQHIRVCILTILRGPRFGYC